MSPCSTRDRAGAAGRGVGLSFPFPIICTRIAQGKETYGPVHRLGPLPLPCRGRHRLPSQLGADVSKDLKPPLPLDQPVPAECTQCSELPTPPASTAALSPGLPDRLPDHADLQRLPWL